MVAGPTLVRTGHLVSRRPPATAAVRIGLFLRRSVLGQQTTVELVVPLAVLSLVSVLGTAAAPVLWDDPLLLVALSPRLPFLMLAGPRTGWLLFMVVGTARLCLADPLHFRLGRRVAARSGAVGGPRRARLRRNSAIPGVRWRRRPDLSRLCGRVAGHPLARPVAALLVVLRPNGRHLALAGAVGLRGPFVLALDLAGTAAYLAGVHRAATLFA